MITAGIVLALLLGAGGLVYLVGMSQATPTIIDSAIHSIIAPFTMAIERIITILGYLAPLLMAVVPLAVIMGSKSEDENRGQLVAFGAIFGLALYAIAYFTGVDKLLIQGIRGSMFVGSTLDMAVVSLGAAVEWILGALTGLALWGAGIALAFISSILDAMIGVGEAAKRAKGPVRKTQQGILERLLGRA